MREGGSVCIRNTRWGLTGFPHVLVTNCRVILIWGRDSHFLGLGVSQGHIPYVLLGCIWRLSLGWVSVSPWDLAACTNYVNIQEQVIILHKGGCTVM